MSEFDQSYEPEQAHELVHEQEFQQEYQPEHEVVHENENEVEHAHDNEIEHTQNENEENEPEEGIPDSSHPDDKEDHAEKPVVGDGERWPGWPGESIFRMLVSAQKVGSIIGRKGEYIKKTCEETKARIKILDGPPGTRERAGHELQNWLQNVLYCKT